MSSLSGPVLAEYQDLYSSTTTQGGPNGGLKLGAKAYTGDGREFRFTLAGATTLVPGKLQQGPAQTTAWQNVAVAAASVGATSVTITASLTATANILAGGSLVISTTPGQGYQYEIAGNSAVSGATGMVVYLIDPIQVAITSSSTVTLMPNLYHSVVVYPATVTGSPAGVAVFPVVNGQFGWLQVAGASAVLNDGGSTVGESLVPSASVAGALKTFTGDLPPVGYSMQTATDTDYGLVWLTIG